MEKQQGRCDVSQLAVLLGDDEQSDSFQEAMSHLEQCPECQVKLTDLAADSQTWAEIRESLAGQPAVRQAWLSDPPAGPTRQLRPDADLDCLEPADHPELLGRLGRYHVESVIGYGGMGVVLKGFDTELNRPVALKVLGRHLTHSGAARQRFAREARAAAAVVHEHVVAIHNVESEEAVPFLVMQYVPGESLQVRVDRDGPLQVKEILRVGMQATAGLAAAHEQGLVHRDVKPGNILLEHGVERALLTDFGLARAVDDATLTHTGMITGTPHYMSPEQANGGAVDCRSDLFSLGAVLYFMATGHPPFRSDRAMGVLHRICHDRHRPVWQVNEEIPDALSDIIDRLLEKKPHKRFGSAAEAYTALAQTLAQLQDRRSSRRRLGRRIGHVRLLLGGSTLLIAGALVVAGLTVPHPISPPASPGEQAGDLLPSDSSSLRDLAALSILEASAFEITQDIRELEGTLATDRFLQDSDDGWTANVNAIQADADALQRSLTRQRTFPTQPGDER